MPVSWVLRFFLVSLKIAKSFGDQRVGEDGDFSGSAAVVMLALDWCAAC